MEQTVAPKRFIGESVSPWSNGAFCAVSFAYVGGLPEHLELAVPLLRQLGLPATFFLDPLNVIDDVRPWDALKATEHEIGLAPFGDATRSGFLPGWTNGGFGEEIRSAKRFVRDVFGVKATSLYHPGGTLYGDVANFSEIMHREFPTVVTSISGQNTPLSSTQHLQVLDIKRYPSMDLSRAFDSDEPTWVIIPFSGLFEGDFTKILMHRMIVEAIGRNRSKLRIGTVSEIASELRLRQSPVQ